MTQLTATELTATQPAAPGAESDFDRTTTATPVPGRPGEFAVDLDAGWLSLVGIHGGYMCALAARCAGTLAPDRTVRTLTTTFLRTGSPGPASLSVREVRRGRSMTTMVAELRQDGHLLIVSRITLLTHRTGLEWRRSPIVDRLPPPAACEPIEQEGVSHFERAEGLLDPAGLPFSGGDRAMVQGYVRPLENRSVDPPWLAMATDWFPPPAFVRVDPPTGGVSVDLTTHIHRPDLVLAHDEWLVGRFEVATSSAGLAVEHGTIVTGDGAPVAESFQTRLTAQD